jgi:microcystin-dependent protein
MVADTYSSLLGWLDQGTGNNNNTWGDNCDISVFTVLEKGITGFVTRAVTGGATDLSASPPPAGPTAALEYIQQFTGTLVADQTVTVPNLAKTWLVYNSCTLGAFNLKFKTPAGSAVNIPLGWQIVWCDGSNVIRIGLGTGLRDFQWLGTDGTLAAPAWSFTNEAGLGVRRAGAGDLRGAIGGVDIWSMTTGGFNILSGTVLLNGAPIIPYGAEMDFAGHTEPTRWAFIYGQAVSRATYANVLGAITKTTTGTPTNGSNTLTSVGADLRNLGFIGAFIEGTNIPLGTTITAIAATTITMSANATGSPGSVAIRILPYGQGDGVTTFNFPDRRGRVTAARDDMGGSAAGRLTSSSAAGLDGTKLSGVGGSEGATISQAQLPSCTFANSGITLNDPGHVHNVLVKWNGSNASSQCCTNFMNAVTDSGSQSATLTSGAQSNTTGITITAQGSAASGGSGTAHANVQPTSIANRIMFTGV